MKPLIKQIRVSQGKTAIEMAKAIGVSYNYMFNLESGSRTPTLARLIKIADYLGVSIADLYSDTADNA